MSDKKADPLQGAYERIAQAIGQKLRVNCGDWIYPSQGNTTRVKYPIEYPLVLEFFLQNRAAWEMSSRASCGFHLTGPRYAVIKIEGASQEAETTMRIAGLRNEQEEEYSRDVGFTFSFSLAQLARLDEIATWPDDGWPSLLLTSALLQYRMTQGFTGNPINFPEDVRIREATISEIETLGSRFWR